MKKIGTSLALFGALLLVAACNKKADFDYHYYSPEEFATLSQYLNLPDLPDDYTVNFPTHLRNAGLFPRPVERDKAVLGRVLFYDTKLSKDGTIACASCHKQELGFGDNVAFSRGVYDRSTARNSISLASVSNFSAYYGTDLNGSQAIRFFWDNRAETAAEQSQGSLTNEREMDMHMDEVVAAVQSQPYYSPLFKKAFGDDYVTTDRVKESISNFVNAIGSYQSKFDEEASKINVYAYPANYNNFNGFSNQQNRGLQIYQTNCASCHSPIMGRPMLFNASNGLNAATDPNDRGVGPITGLQEDEGTFKIPTLRNIALTAPYMHDGRFNTLEEVVEFYNSGIQDHPNLHPNLKVNGSPLRLNLSNSDKQDLITFLHTLTDDHVSADTRFSNPFKQ
ncbi:MAG TPA: cytochrome c peroxidase [Saprospiraceae bacterium]|nr:cytochrome c peroxidase [Saprospiraceae bacterium]